MNQWDKDPAVIQMRRYFSKMEDMDTALVLRLGISPFDPRLKQARKKRLTAFERSCARAVNSGLKMDEHTWFDIFTLCQDLAFQHCGLIRSREPHAGNPELRLLIMEDFK